MLHTIEILASIGKKNPISPVCKLVIVLDLPMWTIITCHGSMELAIGLSIPLRKPSEHTYHGHRVKDKLCSASFLPDRWKDQEVFLLLTLSPVYKLVGFLVIVLDLLM